LESIAARPEPAGDAPPFDRALARSLLARVLWSDPSARPRALQLAAQARQEYVSRGEGGSRAKVELDRWLAGRGK
jgi:hypothetical protein